MLGELAGINISLLWGDGERTQKEIQAIPASTIKNGTKMLLHITLERKHSQRVREPTLALPGRP